MFSPDELVFILDKIGIVSFAFTGAAIGIKKKLDIFGVILLSVTNAVGGGILRDLILARIPFAISHSDYLEFATGAGALAILFYYFKLNVPKKLIIISDTLGLGAFAAAGITVSLTLHLSIFHTVLFSVVTAVGGGMIRDILINEIPFIMKKEIYATAAAIGAIVSYFSIGLGISQAIFIGAIATIVVRTLAITLKLHLPILR